MKNLNQNLKQRAFMDTHRMERQPSPSPAVWRKRLDPIGGEFGRVSSVVRHGSFGR